MSTYNTIKSSYKRLLETINEAKAYLQQKNNPLKEFEKQEKKLMRRHEQFKKDLFEFQPSEGDEPSKEECEDVKLDGEDLLEELKEYIEIEQRDAVEKEKLRQAEEREKVRQIENEERKRMHELEKIKMQMQLEEMRTSRDVQRTREEQNPSIPVRSNIRLPKLELKTFNGDRLKWQGFWDSFEATIHKNNSLQPIEKFNYLRSQLREEALRAITGLDLTNENYEEAIKVLKERYGNEQLIIDKHYTKLMELPAATNKTSSLRSTYDEIEQHLRSLESLKQDINHPHFISMIRSKLPKVVIIRLEQQKVGQDTWTVKFLRDSLNAYIKAQEIAENQCNSTKLNNQTENNENRRTNVSFNERPHGTINTLLSNERKQFKNNRCIYCDQSHWSDECKAYSTVESRRERLKGKCFICLKGNHVKKHCPTDKACYHCKQKNAHHRSLCPDKFRSPLKREPIANNTLLANTVKEKDNDPADQELSLLAGNQVIMQTALVEAQNDEGERSVVTRILMDTGSQRTYITEDVAKRLCLQTEDTERISVFGFGTAQPKDLLTRIVSVTLKGKDGNILKIKASIIPQITGNIIRSPIHLEERFELKKRFTLADTLPTRDESLNIGILIGGDYYQEIMTTQRVKIQEGLYAIKSKFGWIISGKIDAVDRKSTESALFVQTFTTSPTLQEFTGMSQIMHETPVNASLEEFWSLERIGIEGKGNSAFQDEQVLEYFNNTITKEGNRYQVGWPWKYEEPKLPDNYALCVGRLKSLFKRMKNDPEVLQKYDAIIQDQLKRGIIEKVNTNYSQNDNRLLHYIPHHAVFKLDNETTKVRVVYDASAKTHKNNLSLNECLHKGPVILEDLCGLLMRFRTKQIAIIADIEKAFHQIELLGKDRDVTRFLWLKNLKQPPDHENIQVLRFARVPFGVVSSPFILGATIRHHLQENPPEINSDLTKDIYVDNLITGTDSVEEAKSIYSIAKESFNSISMNLREWTSNSSQFKNYVQDEDKKKNIITKVLGVYWDTSNDMLSLPVKKYERLPLATTKRQVLAQIASLFDPLGLLSPTTVIAKDFLQRLWKKDMNWDDKLTESQQTEWKNILVDWNGLKTIQIPRYIGVDKKQLFCFVDASKKSYATAIYLKTKYDGNTYVNLIFAKTRITPKKHISIPRLELLAVLIGVRSMKFVAKELHLENDKKIVWTDSQCVLSWLKSTKPLSVFVRNRVTEITEDKTMEFRYIKTHENPADLPTRGISSAALKTSDAWWHGPSWLRQQEIHWPMWNYSYIDNKLLESIQSEIKEKILYEVSSVSHNSQSNEFQKAHTPFNIDETRCSSYMKLLRITAYVRRFISIIKKERTQIGIPTAHEVAQSALAWIKCIQRKHFYTISKGKRVLKENIRNNQLNPKIDTEDIIRCYGRLQNSSLPVDTINPILLPRNEIFVTLLIEHIHKSIFHGGVNHTLSELRKSFWITKGRAEVKRVLRSCLVCRKHQGGTFKMPPMTPWPKQKVTRSLPFKYVGLDYFGPLYIKQYQKTAPKVKVWICLFTCITVRAVHLEIVENMTAEHFLFALRRFIARRGKPDEIISDNALQFKLAKSTVEAAFSKVKLDREIQSFIAEKGITWKFNVELSPWMGGFYERMVGICKTALKRAIGRNCLTNTQLQTFLAEAEAIVNSRPLVYIGEQIEDRPYLTPSHFLTPNTATGTPLIANEEEKDDPDFLATVSSVDELLQLWKKGQNLLNTFWKSWNNDYLLSLRERSQVNLKSRRIKSQREPQIGDIVQIEDKCPRGCWKVGKIVELMKNSEDSIRAASILLPSKQCINRPLNMLYPLELSSENKFNEKEIVTHDSHSKDIVTSEHNEKNKRPSRKAALEARDKIVASNLDDT